MGAEKKGYVGGFLQLFDWNAKSRKKLLFSTKSGIPDQSKQKKRLDGNFPISRVQLIEDDYISAESNSIKGSSDYSCASSVTDGDICGRRPPGVVAKLMGLDSLPTNNFSEPYSTPISDSHSLRDFCHRSGNLESHHDQILEASVRNMIEMKHQKSINQRIEKFQTEILPPKSAKSIPSTHHKLLSPIKSSNFVPSKDAAQIMEAAARIIERGPQVTVKARIPSIGSSSAPLKVRDLKEKVEASQKPSNFSEGRLQRPGESSEAKYLKGQSMNKSWNGSADMKFTRVSSDSEECSTSTKDKGKSISLALQAKANIQKREGLKNSCGIRYMNAEKEPSKISFKSKPSGQNKTQRKISTQGSSSVLRQNNQKQNCLADIGKSPLKPSAPNTQGRKGSVGRQKSSNKTAGTCKVGSGRVSLDVADDKEENSYSYSNTKNPTRKKRCIEGNYQFEKKSAAEDKNRNAMDIVSFTFTAPMSRSMPGTDTSTGVRGFTENYRGKRMLLSSDDSSSSNLSPLGKSVLQGDALSTLLEQKLRELTITVEASQQKASIADTSASNFSLLSPDIDGREVMHKGNPISQVSSGISSTEFQGLLRKHKCLETEGEMDNYGSPISIFGTSFFARSCNSSETADSNSIGGSKLCSSVQAQDVVGLSSLKGFHPVENDVELSDSASSASIVSSGQSTKWELEYVKEILCNIEPMFKNFALGRARNIINPHLLNHLELKKGALRTNGHNSKLRRKALFDCVSESLDIRCTQYVTGGCKALGKGLSAVRQKDILAEEVYNEISCWSAMRSYMVDELVDKDMSSQYGRWLDFKCEAFELGLQIENRILNLLIDEVVADMLVL